MESSDSEKTDDFVGSIEKHRGGKKKTINLKNFARKESIAGLKYNTSDLSDEKKKLEAIKKI